MKKFTLITGAFLLVLTAAGACLADQTFIDWRGGFYFQYPDNWHEIEYRQVNTFLGLQNVSRDEFDYDVALAPNSKLPFWETPYVFVSSFQSGKLSKAEIDSALNSISSEYGADCINGNWVTGDYNLEIAKPVYDKSIPAVAVRDIFRTQDAEKMFLQMRVFHNKGIAVFSCYAPDSVYKDVEKVFIKMAATLSTEDLHEVAPKESTQFVDLSQREVQKAKHPTDSDKTAGSSTHEYSWLIIISGVVVLVAAIILIAKMKNSN